MAIEGGVDDIRGIQDMGVGTKKKEDHSSSNSGKKQRTYVPQVSQIQGQGRVASQVGQMVCLHCRPPGYMRRDYPKRQISKDFGIS